MPSFADSTICTFYHPDHLMGVSWHRWYPVHSQSSKMDWRRLKENILLPFIEMNWTTAYKTLLLEWFCILDFLRIKRHQSMYWITMRHILAQFIQLAANQFGEEYICFPSFENLAWISFSSKGIMYAFRHLMKRVIIFNDFPILFTEAPLTCGCWLVVLSKQDTFA